MCLSRSQPAGGGGGREAPARKQGHCKGPQGKKARDQPEFGGSAGYSTCC